MDKQQRLNSYLNQQKQTTPVGSRSHTPTRENANLPPRPPQAQASPGQSAQSRQPASPRAPASPGHSSNSRAPSSPKQQETGLVHVEDITLEDFKNFVKKWLELDGYVKKAQEIIKDKKRQRNKIAEVITKFMCKYNIEDLNTKEGRIRCKTTHTKAPVTQKQIKEKLTVCLLRRAIISRA